MDQGSVPSSQLERLQLPSSLSNFVMEKIPKVQSFLTSVLGILFESFLTCTYMPLERLVNNFYGKPLDRMKKERLYHGHQICTVIRSSTCPYKIK